MIACNILEQALFEKASTINILPTSTHVDIYYSNDLVKGGRLYQYPCEQHLVIVDVFRRLAKMEGLSIGSFEYRDNNGFQHLVRLNIGNNNLSETIEMKVSPAVDEEQPIAASIHV